jgi:hypothetical protein
MMQVRRLDFREREREGAMVTVHKGFKLFVMVFNP